MARSPLDGSTIVCGTTTGLKIGSSTSNKLAFFNPAYRAVRYNGRPQAFNRKRGYRACRFNLYRERGFNGLYHFRYRQKH